MTLRMTNFLIALAVSGLLAYGIWSLDGSLRNYIAVGSFAYFAGTLVPAIGIEYEYSRRAANVRVVCGSFFVVGLLANLVYSFVGSSPILYIIGSAICFLLYMFIANAIYSVKQ